MSGEEHSYGGPVTVEIEAQRAYGSQAPDVVSTMADLTDPDERGRLTPAALTGLLRIAELWHLTDAEVVALLGDSISVPTLRRWRRRPPATLSVDQLERCSLIAGIHRALGVLLSPEHAHAWVTRPNSGPLYGGRRPLDVMIRGRMSGLAAVRRHLDAVRGGG